MNSASSQSGRKDELEVWVLLHEFSKFIYWCSLNYPQSRVSLNLATSLLAERPHDLTCIVRIRQMQLHLFTFFKWMKRFTCWHMGESKTVPSQGILTTTSAWVAVELAPLCSRVDFQETCLCQNEGFPKPYYRVTQKKLFCVFRGPNWNFKLRPWDTSHRNNMKWEYSCVSLSDVPEATALGTKPSSWHF